ncbi:hypothetical protein [Dryocola sp. BD626]|uniref:hypothetical protein n=1 Tax=Dryocola sp. BD626 TaxID=3133273 RepID=UPI003F507EAB
MKLTIILLATLLTACNAATYRHVNGNDVTLISVKEGATAQVVDGSQTISLSAAQCQ